MQIVREFCDECREEVNDFPGLYRLDGREYCSYCIEQKTWERDITHTFFRGIIFYGATCTCGWVLDKDEADLRDSCKREALKHSKECGSCYVDPPPFDVLKNRREAKWT